MAIPSPYLLAMSIGREGVDDGEFSSPTGITLDKDGNIYVADTDNHSIQKLDKSGKFLARWGGDPSSQEGSFYYPRGLAVGPNDVLYIADSGNNRMQKFDLDGNVMQAWGKFGFAWRGADLGRFDVPWGLATDAEGNLYVSDTSNARIQKFTSDGQALLKWGRDGSFDGAFFFPRGVAVDFVGNIFVADESNNRIQKFDARGSFLAKWGREGAGPGQFKSPWGIACDALGHVYVVDTGNHRIQKFDGNGTYLCAWGNRGRTEGQLNFPYGIAVDKEGAVYVVDSGNGRILKYVPTDEELNRGKDEASTSQVPSETPPPRSVAVKAGDTEAFLSWMEVPGAQSYNLYFNTVPKLTTQTATKIEGVTNPYAHTGLSNDTPYHYAVTAVFETGAESELSSEVTATPVLIDITAPQNPYAVINHGAFMTNTPEVIVTISANDVDTGVAAYFISEAPMTPMAGTPGWVDVTPATKFGATMFICRCETAETIDVWLRCGGNVSTPRAHHSVTRRILCVVNVAAQQWRTLAGRRLWLRLRTLRRSTRLAVRVDTQQSSAEIDNTATSSSCGHRLANRTSITSGIACDGRRCGVVDTNNHRVHKFERNLGGFL